MTKKFDRKLVLEDGSEYFGFGFGGKSDRVCEVVFDTSMVGYQEAISDPSYTYQMVVMTYPIIGSYGITEDDFESKNPVIGGLIVRDYNDMPSNFRYTKTLSEALEESDIPGISGIDTRKITRILRDKGTMKGIITDAEAPLEGALEIIKNTPEPLDAVKKVSSKKRWYSRTSNHKFNVVIIDCGVKLSIIEKLKERGCNVTVVPYDTAAEEIEFMNPDGVFLSNGPGNPENIPQVVETVKKLISKYPIFGVDMGFLIIGLAYGAKICKLKHGHRGGNHPVRNIKTNKIEVVTQNHGYAIDKASLEKTSLALTHINLMDNTAEGFACENDKIYAVQYLPEITPGSKAVKCFYDQFIEVMEESKNA